MDTESAPPCPRCRWRAIRALGSAGSRLEWYSCTACQHVWAAGPMVEPDAPAAAASRSLKHVVVVDDDMSMLSVLERTLADYRVSTARDATEAMAILSARERVDLLITDYLMPGMNGEELTHHARATRIGLKVLVITGHANAVERAEPAWWDSEAHLVKPFRIVALRDAVEALIGPP
ncbi:MAG TPA: response regulator [Vicinamibacterales bacterium]|nr:response regulator [Vicinamibacterales bacterium]